MEKEFKIIHQQKSAELYSLIESQRKEKINQVNQWKKKALVSNSKMTDINNEVKALVKENNPSAETNDKDYIFMNYVIDYLPHGVIGLLFAVMFSAAMSSTASELNALASTTTIDIYKRSIKK